MGSQRINGYDGSVRKMLKLTTIVKIAILALLVAVFVYLQVRWDLVAFFSQERITSWLVMTGPFAPLVYMLIMAAAVILSPIPSLPLDILAGAFFGSWLGTLYSALGALGGAVVSLLIGRYLGGKLVERLMGGHILFCDQCSDKLFTKVIFLSRLVPVVSFDIVSYGAGLTKISLKHFALATFLGMLPLTFVYNYFGSIIVLGGWVGVVVGLAFVAIFLLLPRWIEKHNFLSLKKYFPHVDNHEESG